MRRETVFQLFFVRPFFFVEFVLYLLAGTPRKNLGNHGKIGPEDF